jgi:acetyl esterase
MSHDGHPPGPPTRAREGGETLPLHPQVKTLLDGLAQMEGPSLSEVSPEVARTMYKALLALETPEEVARVDDRVVPGAVEVPIRVYTPAEAVGGDAPLLLWFHGGGWVIGDLDTADPTARALANRSGAVVVSVDYRLAPEHTAPAALDDAFVALTWAVENAELLGADASRVAVGGDSAGGNLAAALCQRVRDEFGPEIDFQLLVYPVVDCTLSHPSMDENAEGYFLTKDSMVWFVGHYLGGIDAKDPAVSPLHCDDLAGLPPAMVITAEFDPLRDEGEAYAEAMREAGVAVEAVRFDGQIHGFFAMTAMLDDARDALDRAGGAVRAALSG